MAAVADAGRPGPRSSLAYARARVLESSFRPANTDPLVVARFSRNGIPDESTLLVDQFADLLAGCAAPAEVFPRIARWLAERSGA